MENVQNQRYNGYANYNTWNIALWLQNDEFLNMEAFKFGTKGYLAFVKYISTVGGDISFQTPDKVEWADPTLDIKALDRMLRDF